MSNQEAIALLRNLEDSLDAYCELNEEGKTAFRMAIEALNCSEFPNSSDCISRQAAIDALCSVCESNCNKSDFVYNAPQDEQVILCPEHYALTVLPSAQPEPHYDEWCDDCKEYDKERHCCPRWNRVIRQTLKDAQPDQDREFIKLTVRNSNGRPYYSIIYLEVDDNGVGRDFEGYSSYSLDVISDYLKKYFMPSALLEPQWIPVSERLPEKPYGCFVTVWDTNPATFDEIENILPYFVGWDGEQWNDADGEQCPFEVIAWMPLPEPYKGET